ncbi:hypothetical protein NDU88_010898 [Pleurodeles waltl]|uniref:Uncharacterized protein n=1 Tax=Pleurodeles waltl TaxID=8319 RepID=A0AAV7PW76_PLEWA|nr:hypothetical protein NDU88_010898 [Pleurodeles waltl]
MGAPRMPCGEVDDCGMFAQQHILSTDTPEFVVPLAPWLQRSCLVAERPLCNRKPWERRRPLLVPRHCQLTPHNAAMDRILQEITALERRMEAMDSKISNLTIASTSIRANIAGFRETVTDLD